MKYCTNCGTAIEENESRLCDACASKSEQAAAAAASSSAQAGPSVHADQLKQTAMTYVHMAKQYLLDPEGNLGKTHHYPNVWPGAVFAVISAIVMGLISLVFVSRVVKAIDGFIGGFVGMLLMDVSGFRLKIPYFEIFLKITLLLIASWLILSFLIVGISKLFKQNITPVQALNGVGVTKLYLAAGAVAMLILSFINMALGSAVLFGSLVLAYLATDRAIKPLLGQRTILILPISATLNLIVQFILIRGIF